jgi:hypothetical protein
MGSGGTLSTTIKARRCGIPTDHVVSSASLILTDGSLALCEPKAVGAQGSTKVLAASSLGSCLVFVSSAVVTIALAAIGRDMRLSPLELQWVMNAELLPLAALTLVAGALGLSSPSPCSAASCSRAVLSCSQDFIWRWLSPQPRAFSPRSQCS